MFPCSPGTKWPATKHGFKDATTNVDAINAWWTAEPDYNPAFSPGDAGLGVVDLDGGQVGEASWAGLEAEHGYAPETYEIRTPSGGRHMYYEGDLPPSASKLGRKVDTRGQGSYALVPPSIIDSRYSDDPAKWGTYTVLADLPFARVPGWVVELAGAKRVRAKATVDTLDLPQNIARATSYLKHAAPAIEGEGGDTHTYIVACEVMTLGVSPDMALSLMEAHWNPRCEPPWDTGDLEIKIERALAYQQNEPGSFAVQPASEVFGDALGKLNLEDAPVARNRFRPWSLEELAALPPPEWLIDEMLPAKGISLMYGPPGCYKSFLALQLGLGLAMEGRKVIYIGAEGGRGLELRAAAWKLANGVSGPLPIWIVPDMPWAADGSMIEEFIEAVAEYKPELVVVDTAARMMVGLNENDARDVGVFIAALDAIKLKLGCAVLALHHTGKDEGRGARGSVAMPAAVDASFEIKADKETKVVAMFCRRQKDAEERSEPWCFQGKPLGPSLYFEPIPASAYYAGASAGEMDSREVGAALTTLKAYGLENAVSTHILALTMAGDTSDLTDDIAALSVSNLERALSKGARGGLKAYCIGTGPKTAWHLPALAA